MYFAHNDGITNLDHRDISHMERCGPNWNQDSLQLLKITMKNGVKLRLLFADEDTAEQHESEFLELVE